MPYQSLKSLFYRDQTPSRFVANERLASERLNAESTFRTGIQTPFGELFLAVPRELSLLNEGVLRHERTISNALQSLPPVAHSALVRSLVVDEVVSTNDLEGVHSTRRQINDLLAEPEGSSTPVASRRFRELARLYLGISDPTRRFPRTPEDVRAIYDLVMQDEDLGGDVPDGRLFRKGGVDVWGDDGKRLHEGLFPESAIIRGIEQMLSIVNSDDMPATYAAIVGHYVFEYVHPFYDGNGRTGRYLLALYLSRPLSLVTSLSLSRFIAENRGSYYRSFKEVEHKLNHGELTLFVMGVLEYVSKAQDVIDSDLQEKRLQLDEALARLDGLAASDGLARKETEALDQLVQLELFAAFPEASVAEVAEHLKLSTQQARRHLKRLEERGLVYAISQRPLRFCLTYGAKQHLDL